MERFDTNFVQYFTCFKNENVINNPINVLHISDKITNEPRLYFQNTYSKMKTNIRL